MTTTAKQMLSKAEFPANEDYHASERISFTKLKVFMQSPKAYHHRFVLGFDLGPTPAMTLGSLVHSMVLTPTILKEEFQVRKDMPLRSKADKAKYIDHMVKIGAVKPGEEMEVEGLPAADLRNLELKSHITFVDQATWDRASAIAETVKPFFPDVVDSLDSTEINTEAAFSATIAGDEVQCKTDHINNAGRVMDIKTTADLTRWANGLEYGDLLLADAFYRMVIEGATGILPDPVIYVGVSTTEPYDVAPRQYPARAFDLARIRVETALQQLWECRERNQWPGIDGPNPEPKEVTLKPWTLKQLERDAGLTLDGEDFNEDALAAYVLANVD
jgi:hypothetical protein